MSTQPENESNENDAQFEERRRIAAEAAGLARIGTTEDGRAVYGEQLDPETGASLGTTYPVAEWRRENDLGVWREQ